MPRPLDLAGPVTTLRVLERNAQARRLDERRGWSPNGTAFGVTELRYGRTARRS